MLELVAQGDGTNTHLLRKVADRTGGSGAIEFELDTEFDIPGPNWLTGPNIKIGAAIRAGIPALELILKAIPGVHLDHGIQFTDRNGRGTLRIPVRNNPAPLVLGGVVAAILPWLIAFGVLLVVVIIGWKLFKGDVKGVATVGITLILVVLGVAVVLLFVFGKAGKLSGLRPSIPGG